METAILCLSVTACRFPSADTLPFSALQNAQHIAQLSDAMLSCPRFPMIDRVNVIFQTLPKITNNNVLADLTMDTATNFNAFHILQHAVRVTPVALKCTC